MNSFYKTISYKIDLMWLELWSRVFSCVTSSYTCPTRTMCYRYCGDRSVMKPVSCPSYSDKGLQNRSVATINEKDCEKLKCECITLLPVNFTPCGITKVYMNHVKFNIIYFCPWPGWCSNARKQATGLRHDQSQRTQWHRKERWYILY